MISFLLNNKLIHTTVAPGTTLLDFIRYDRHLKGTKIGCREGDCGACTILIGKLQEGTIKYKSMTSCLTPLINCTGCHVVTIEGINGDGLTPVQEAVADEGGTQCGFCTVGFIMSLTGNCMQSSPCDAAKMIASMDGNICRCTGYKSLERAAHRITALLQKHTGDNRIKWLTEEGYLPLYFLTVEKQLAELGTDESEAAGMVTGGGTDLYVQKHESMVHEKIHAVYNKMNAIEHDHEKITMGASVTVEDLKNSHVFNYHFPQLQKHLKLVSSTPIRNMATIAGNIVNASPIGDMTIFFLALNAELTLNSNGNLRKVSLRDFYSGYKTMDKKHDEIIEAITISKPASGFHFNFEKVSKRMHLDIASVNTAIGFYIQDGRMQQVHLSMGGVFAYPKYLVNTAAFLSGKEITDENIIQAVEILQEEIIPISDARGHKDYKRLLAKQLFKAHFLELKVLEL